MMFKYSYDDNSTPAEVRNVRQSVFDYTFRYGNPVVIKRIYNTDDIAVGKTAWDSTFDDVYEQSSTKAIIWDLVQVGAMDILLTSRLEMEI